MLTNKFQKMLDWRQCQINRWVPSLNNQILIINATPKLYSDIPKSILEYTMTMFQTLSKNIYTTIIWSYAMINKKIVTSNSNTSNEFEFFNFQIKFKNCKMKVII